MARRRKNIKVNLRKLGRERAWGQAIEAELVVDVDYRVKPIFFCQLLCHEVGHLFFPDASETRIDKFGRKMAQILFDFGFRRIYDENKRMAPYPKKKKKP